MSIKHENPLVQSVGQEIASRLADIESYFKRDAKLTLLVRHPGHPDRDMLVTNDDLGEVTAAVQRRKDAES